MLEQVNVKLFAACAEQYTPAALATLQLAGAGDTSTKLEAVTPLTLTEIVLLVVFQLATAREAVLVVAVLPFAGVCQVPLLAKNVVVAVPNVILELFKFEADSSLITNLSPLAIATVVVISPPEVILPCACVEAANPDTVWV